MKKLLVLSTAILFAFTMNAQKIGVKAGYGMSGYLVNFDSPDGAKMGNGFNAGLLGEYPVNDMMSLRTDVTYNQLGSDYYHQESTAGTTVTSDYKTDVSYLQIGVAPKFNFGPAYAFVGPYFGYALSNITNGTTVVGETTLKEAKDLDNFADVSKGGMGDFYNKTDFGFNLGFGADFSGVFVELNAGLGLMNFLNKDSELYEDISKGAKLLNDANINAKEAGFLFTSGTKAVEEPSQKNLFFGLSVGYMLNFGE